MEKLKVYIRPVTLWEFKNIKNATETAKKISCIYCQGVITVLWNWCSMFRSGDTSLRDELRLGRSSDLDQATLKELVEYNLRNNTWELVLDINVS